jgi:hypothetical protein
MYRGVSVYPDICCSTATDAAAAEAAAAIKAGAASYRFSICAFIC